MHLPTPWEAPRRPRLQRTDPSRAPRAPSPLAGGGSARKGPSSALYIYHIIYIISNIITTTTINNNEGCLPLRREKTGGSDLP